MEEKISSTVLPISFDETSYFNNEYRGDLIITEGAIYYFPHTRVSYARHSDELAGRETAEIIGALGSAIPLLGTVPWVRTAADKTVKLGKMIRRTFHPSINRPRIAEKGLWSGRLTSAQVQRSLDWYIAEQRDQPLRFDEDSVPKPMGFRAEEIENLTVGMKFKFDARYDTHDFRVNPIRRNLLRKALREAGFLKDL